MLYWNDWFSCYKKPPVTWMRPIQLCMDQWVAVSDSGGKLRVTLICLAFLLACVSFVCSECMDLFYGRPFLTCHSRRSTVFLITLNDNIPLRWGIVGSHGLLAQLGLVHMYIFRNRYFFPLIKQTVHTTSYKISLYTWERKPDSKCSNKHAGAGGGNNVETKKNILSMRTSELILFK